MCVCSISVTIVIILSDLHVIMSVPLMVVMYDTHAENESPLTVYGSGSPLRQFIYSKVSGCMYGLCVTNPLCRTLLSCLCGY